MHDVKKYGRGISVLAVANAFIWAARKAGKRLKHFQLQQLMYIAQGVALAFHDRVLFYDDVEAWKYGPIVSDLYHALTEYGAGEVRNLIDTDDDAPIDEVVEGIVGIVYEAYGDKDDVALSGLTHQKDTPWYIAWEKGDKVIGVELIREKFENWLQMASREHEA